MTIIVEAIYENGVLKPDRPLPIKEHERIQVTVQDVPRAESAANDAEAFVRRSYGLLQWKGDREALRRLAEDPELDPQESA